MDEKSIYSQIIETIFFSRYKMGAREVDFEREDIVKVSKKLGIASPKNLGDVVYSFRYRKALPEKVQEQAGESEMWIIRPAGRAKYRFVLVPNRPLVPNDNLTVTKVPDATPGIVAKYSFNDEQALLAKKYVTTD